MIIFHSFPTDEVYMKIISIYKTVKKSGSSRGYISPRHPVAASKREKGNGHGSALSYKLLETKTPRSTLQKNWYVGRCHGKGNKEKWNVSPSSFFRLFITFWLAWWEKIAFSSPRARRVDQLSRKQDEIVQKAIFPLCFTSSSSSSVSGKKRESSKSSFSLETRRGTHYSCQFHYLFNLPSSW